MTATETHTVSSIPEDEGQLYVKCDLKNKVQQQRKGHIRKTFHRLGDPSPPQSVRLVIQKTITEEKEEKRGRRRRRERATATATINTNNNDNQNTRRTKQANKNKQTNKNDTKPASPVKLETSVWNSFTAAPDSSTVQTTAGRRVPSPPRHQNTEVYACCTCKQTSVCYSYHALLNIDTQTQPPSPLLLLPPPPSPFAYPQQDHRIRKPQAETTWWVRTCLRRLTAVWCCLQGTHDVSCIFDLSLSLSYTHTHTRERTCTHSRTHTHTYEYVQVRVSVWRHGMRTNDSLSVQPVCEHAHTHHFQRQNLRFRLKRCHGGRG